MSKPRDLGLLLWCLLHRVPVESRVTERWIEVARRHCQMSSERLAELRGELYTKYWARMEQKRDRRLAYFRACGEVPRGWTPTGPGKQDRTYQTLRMKLYWQTRAKAKARMRKRPDAASAKLTNAYFATRKIKSRSRKLAALNAAESMLIDHVVADSPTISFREWLGLQNVKNIRDGEYLRLSRGTKLAKRIAERENRGNTSYRGKWVEKKRARNLVGWQHRSGPDPAPRIMPEEPRE